MASRRQEKQARRDERQQGSEGAIRRATDALVAAAHSAGHTPARIRDGLVRGAKDALGLGTFETSAVVVDTRTQALVDYAATFRRVCDQERIALLDPAAGARWLSVIQDELEQALKRAR